MASVNLGKATTIIPQLRELISLVQVKRPLYEFHATGFVERRDDVTNSVTVWANEFEVTQDADRIGEIRYERGAGRRTSGGEHPDAFVLRSDNITKQRGRARNTLVTTNITVALKEVIKTFALPDEGTICNSLIHNVRQEFDNREYSWRRVLNDVASYSGVDVYQWIIESHLKGEVQPMPSSFKVETKNLHLYDKFLAGKELVTTANFNSSKGIDRKGIAVKILSDNTIRTVPFSYDLRMTYEDNGSPLMRYRSFEDMPISMQEKIAVLKIAEQAEPIAGIGVKFDEDLMYIVE